MTQNEMLEAFKNLINEFVSSVIDGPVFEEKYISLWREYRDTEGFDEINKRCSNALDRMFTAVDCYCSDPSLRDDEDMDDNQLKMEAKNILNLL